MNKFKYCPIIEVGDVFTRIDKNGKVWKAEVIGRTELFVNVKKTQPYQVKVLDDGIGGDVGCYHYEYAEPIIERCQLKRKREFVKTGNKKHTIWGNDIDEEVEVDTDDYYILVKEEYSRFLCYKHQYFLHKATDKSVGE